LHWAAFHDPLTRLPNRALYQERLRTAIESARQLDRFVALVVLDMNGFKDLNDTLGHAAGDQVLVEMGTRLTRNLPRNATVARLGGDEFAIIIPDLSTLDAHRVFLARLSSDLADTMEYESLSIPISFCGGLAIWPRDASGPEELLI